MEAVQGSTEQPHPFIMCKSRVSDITSGISDIKSRFSDITLHIINTVLSLQFRGLTIMHVYSEVFLKF